MKIWSPLSVLAALSFAALGCASSGDAPTVLDGLAEGTPIHLEVGAIFVPSTAFMPMGDPVSRAPVDGRFEMEVTNLSHSDVTVVGITVHQVDMPESRSVGIESRNMKMIEMLDSGAEHEFDMPLRLDFNQPPPRTLQEQARQTYYAEVEIIVTLQSGEAYRWRAEVPIATDRSR